jgi:hypothetical protein
MGSLSVSCCASVHFSSWILLSCCSGGIVCSIHGFSCHVVVVVLFVVFMDTPVML